MLKRDETMAKNKHPKRSLKRRLHRRAAVLGASVALSLLAGGCSTPLEAARSELASGNYRAAEKIAVEGLEEDKNNGGLYTVLAEAQVEQDAFDLAAPLAERGAALQPDDAHAHAVLGRAYGGALRLPAMCEALSRAHELDPTSIDEVQEEALLILPEAALLASAAGDVERSLLCYDLLEALNSGQFEEHAESRREVAEAVALRRIKLRRMEEAQALLKTLEQRHPEHSSRYRLERLRVFAILNQIDEARAVLDAHIDSTPEAERAEVAAAGGAVLAKWGRLGIAREYFQRALEAAPKRSAWLGEVIGLSLRIGDEETAIAGLARYMDDAHRATPLAAADVVEVSAVAIGLGWSSLVLEYLIDGQKKFPEDEPLTLLLADQLQRRGEVKAVETTLRSYVATIDLTNKETTRAAGLRLGAWTELHGADELMVQLFTTLTPAPGADPALLRALATKLADMRRFDEFERTLDRYVRNEGDTRDAKLDAARLSLELFSSSKVIARLEPLAKANPADGEVMRLLGESYHGLNRLKDEHTLYRRWAEASKTPAGIYLEAGRIHQRQGDEADAEVFFLEAIKDPDFREEARFDLAALLHDTRRFSESEAVFDALVAENDAPNKMRTDIAKFYIRERDTLRAIAILQEIIAEDPQSTETHYTLGREFLRLNQKEEAQRALLQFVLTNEHPKVAAEKSGLLLMRAWDLKLALDFLNDVEAATPDQVYVSRLRGEFHYAHAAQLGAAGEASQARLVNEQAARYFELHIKALADRKETKALLELGVWFSAKTEHELAVRTFEAVIDAEFTGVYHFYFGYSLLHLGREGDASKRFDRFIAGARDPLLARLDAGRRLHGARAFRLAEPYLMKVFEDTTSDKELDEVFALLVDISVRTDHREKVPALATSAVQKSKNQARMLRVAADALARVGRERDAIDWYRSLLKLRPNAADVVVKIASLMQRLGDPEEARRVIEGFVETTKVPSLAWRSAGNFLRNSGQIEAALDAYSHAVETNLDPEFALFLEIGRLQALLGQHDAAMATFTQLIEGEGDRGEIYRRVLNELESVQSLQIADRFAARAVDEVPEESPGFLLRRMKYAQRRGDLFAVLYWTSEYSKRGANLTPLVEWMLERGGTYRETLYWIQEEGEGQSQRSAARHLAALTPEAVMHEGFNRHLQRIQRRSNIFAGLGEVASDFADELIDRGLLAEAIVWLGETQSSVHGALPQSDLLRARLLLERGFGAEAEAGLLALVLRRPREDRASVSSDAVDVLLDANAPERALSLVGTLVNTHHLLELLPTYTRLQLAVGSIDKALNELRGGLGAEAFLPEAPVSQLGNVIEAIITMARAGYGREAFELLGQIVASREDRSHGLALARLEVLALSGDEAALSDAVHAERRAHPDDHSRQELIGQALMKGGAFNEAAKIFEDLVVSPNEEVAIRALRHAVSAAKAEGRPVDKVVKRYLKTRSDLYYARLSTAALLIEVGAFGHASKLLTEATKMFSDSAAPFELLSEAELLAGRFDAAVEAMESAAVRRSDRVETLARFARRATRGPDSLLARRAWQQYIDAVPLDPEALLALARQDVLSGDDASADASLERYLDSAPHRDLAQEEVLALYLDVGEIDAAYPLVEKVVGAKQPSARGLLNAGRVLLAKGEQAPALEAFEAAVGRSLQPLTAQMEIAEAFREVGGLEQVERFLEKAIEANPLSPAPLLYRGILRLDKDDVEGALLDFDAVIRGGYAPSMSLPLMAKALLEKGQAEAGEVYLRRLLATSDRLEALHLVLGVFDAVNESARGVEFIKQERPGWLLVSARHPEMLSEFSDAMVKAGQGEGALTLVASALNERPDSATLWSARAQLALIAEKKPKDAEAMAWRAVGLAADDQRHIGLAMVGAARAAQGDREGAEAAWLASLRLQGDKRVEWLLGVYEALAKNAEALGRGGDAERYRRLGRDRSRQLL